MENQAIHSKRIKQFVLLLDDQLPQLQHMNLLHNKRRVRSMYQLTHTFINVAKER